jgi:hypothetical protein
MLVFGRRGDGEAGGRLRGRGGPIVKSTNVDETSRPLATPTMTSLYSPDLKVYVNENILGPYSERTMEYSS